MTEDEDMVSSNALGVAMFLENAAKRLQTAAEHAREGKPVAAELGDVLEQLAMSFILESSRNDADRWLERVAELLLTARHALQFEATREGYPFQGDEGLRGRGRALAAETVGRIADYAMPGAVRMQKAWADMVFGSSATAPMGTDDSDAAARAQEVRDLAAAVHVILCKPNLMTSGLAALVAEQVPMRIMLHCPTLAAAVPSENLNSSLGEPDRERIAAAVVKCLERPSNRDKGPDSDDVARSVVRTVLRSLGVQENTVRLVFDADRKKLRP